MMRRLIVLATVAIFAVVSAPVVDAHARVATPQDPQASATLQSKTSEAPPSDAQQNARDYSHARIVRLSFVQGDVQIARPEEEGWEEAIANLPIRQGDSLATFRGRAEIEFESGATARLAEHTRLQFTELALADGARVTRITLTQGTASFYANLDKRDQFVVISPGVTVEIPRNARFRMDVRDDRTNVAVSRGDVRVESAAGEYKLSKNDGLLFTPTGATGTVALARLGEPDEFDRWVADRDDAINTARASSLRYVNAPFRYGLSDLSSNGNWIYVSSYGYVWQPYGVAIGWGPYVHGRWVFLRHHGWTWVSYEPWGWVPYHYGRWAHTHYGWVWVPGYFNYWSPAHVVWFRFGRNHGWCPLGPFDRPGPRGVWGRPHHFNQGVVVSTTSGVVQGSRNPGILRNERAGESEPLPSAPTRAEVFGWGRPDRGTSAAAERPAGFAGGFAGTRRDPDAARNPRAGDGPERPSRGEVVDDAGRAGSEAPAAARPAGSGFAGRPNVDRGVDRDEDSAARPRPVPMSPEAIRNPRPPDNGNIEYDPDGQRFVNRPTEGIPRDPESAGGRNPNPRPDAAGPRNNDDPAPRQNNGFSGSVGVPQTGQPDRSARPEPRPRDVTIPRGYDEGADPTPRSNPTPRSEPTPRPNSSYDNNSGYSSRPSQSGGSSSGSGYGTSRPEPRPSSPSPSAQPSQQAPRPPSAPSPSAQPAPRPSSPSSSTGFGGRPSSPPPQPRPQSNFQSQPRPSASAPRPSHKPGPN